MRSRLAVVAVLALVVALVLARFRQHRRRSMQDRPLDLAIAYFGTGAPRRRFRALRWRTLEARGLSGSAVRSLLLAEPGRGCTTDVDQNDYMSLNTSWANAKGRSVFIGTALAEVKITPYGRTSRKEIRVGRSAE
jgi:hypothetical protein